MSAEDWTREFGPFADDGEPIPLEEQPLTVALRADRAGHATYNIRSTTGATREIVAVGLPLVGIKGFEGAMVFFWPSNEEAIA